MDKTAPKSPDDQPDNPSNALVALYLTEETGLPCIAKGYVISPFEAKDSTGARVERLALRVTFEPGASTKYPRHLLTFGSDDQHCNVVLRATEASPIHCRIYAQLNSGPNVWVIEDTSTNGTGYIDEESVRTRIPKNIARGRVAAQGLCRILIGHNIFTFWLPSDNQEKTLRDRYFRDLDPIPVTREVLQEQLHGAPANYRPLAMIGDGGMGAVFRYIEMTTGLMIAVKEEEVKNKDADERVQKEIGYMQSLRHPNLVEHISSNYATSAVGIKKWFTAMPLYQGCLCDILPLAISAIENVMLQLFEGVAFMHAQRILHKDIKPENILVKSKSRPNVVLADYGLCASLNNRAELLLDSGTPGFAAPEVSRMIVQTEAVDVFGLGATFFFILEPERCRGTTATLATLKNVRWRPPRVYAGLVQSMMAREAQERPSLKDCFDIVRTKQRDWQKRTPLARLLPPAPSTSSPRRSLRIQNALAQKPPMNRLEKFAANRPKLTPVAEIRRLQNRPPGLRQILGSDFKALEGFGRIQAPKVLIPPPAPKREPPAPAPVQQVNFAAPPPPAPDNLFADLNRDPDIAPPARRAARPTRTVPHEPARTPIRKPDSEIKRKIRRHPERRKMIQRWHNIGIQGDKICHAVGEIASGKPLNVLSGLCHITAGGIGLTGHSIGLFFKDMVAATDALTDIVPPNSRTWRMNTNRRLMYGLKNVPAPNICPVTLHEYEMERLQSALNYPNPSEARRVRAMLERKGYKFRVVTKEEMKRQHPSKHASRAAR